VLESSADLFGGDEIIVRTALNPDGTALKIDRKTVRKALGPIGGGAVKLTDNAEVTTCLGAGEGTETVLSMRSTPEFDRSPVWALISSNNVASFPVLPGIECLWIAVDNDKPDRCGRRAGNEDALALLRSGLRRSSGRKEPANRPRQERPSGATHWSQ